MYVSEHFYYLITLSKYKQSRIKVVISGKVLDYTLTDAEQTVLISIINPLCLTKIGMLVVGLSESFCFIGYGLGILTRPNNGCQS